MNQSQTFVFSRAQFKRAMANRVTTKGYKKCNCNCHGEDTTGSSSIRDQLKSINNSADIIDFYEKKLESFENDYAQLIHKVEQYKNTCELQYKLELQLAQRDDEISQLQRALSNLQVSFLEEKERVLNLQAENKMLMNTEDESQKRIKNLLAYSSEPTDESTKSLRTDGTSKEHQKDLRTYDSNYCQCIQMLRKIRLLENQVVQKNKLHEQQKETLLKDRQIQCEEAKAQQKRDAHQIRLLTNRLKHTQDLLHNCTEDYVKLQQHHLSVHKTSTVETNSESFVNNRGLKQQQRSTQSSGEFKQRIQSRQSREHSCGRKHDTSATSAQKTTTITRSKESLLEEINRQKQKCESIEKRRQLEIAGFQNDIKHLRKQLSRVEVHLFKLFSDASGDKDAAVLHKIYHNANRSKSLTDSVQELKRRICNLENSVPDTQCGYH